MIRLRKWLRRFIALIVFFLGNFSVESVMAGTGIIIVGSLLHFWAIGTLTRNVQLTKGGPYRLVRHPFYLANFIIDVGICVCGFNPFHLNGYLILIGYLVLFYAVYINRMKKEERDLMGFFGEPYKEYMTKVPRVFPSLVRKLPRRESGTGFSWPKITGSANEIPRLLRLFTYPLGFYLRPDIYQSVQTQQLHLTFQGWIVLGFIILLQFIALGIRLFAKRNHLSKGTTNVI